MKKIGIIAFIFLGILSGCNRTVTCSDQYITPAFIGFKISDLDTVVVRQYQKGDNFLHLIDTALIKSDTSILKSTSSNDTTFILLNHIVGEEKYLFPDHDWQIYIPAKNLTISISNIVSPQTEFSCFKCGCWNPVNSFVQNTLTVVPQSKPIPAFGGGTYLTTYIRP